MAVTITKVCGNPLQTNYTFTAGFEVQIHI